jgi:hypothetical protein
MCSATAAFPPSIGEPKINQKSVFANMGYDLGGAVQDYSGM